MSDPIDRLLDAAESGKSIIKNRDPLQNGILGSTTNSATSVTYDTSTATEVNTALNAPADDLKITPTAAVCSSCHDSTLAQTHMVTVGGAVFDGNADTAFPPEIKGDGKVAGLTGFDTAGLTGQAGNDKNS